LMWLAGPGSELLGYRGSWSSGRSEKWFDFNRVR